MFLQALPTYVFLYPYKMKNNHFLAQPLTQSKALGWGSLLYGYNLQAKAQAANEWAKELEGFKT